MFNRIIDFIGLNPQDEELGYEDEYPAVTDTTQTVTSSPTGAAPSRSPYTDTTTGKSGYTSAGYNTDSFGGSPVSTQTTSAATMAVKPVSANVSNTPNTNNVVGMPGNRWWGAVAEVVVMEPRSFDEMPQVIQSLKDRKSVVLNLTMMDADEAQRAVDFVAGATFTIDGHQERIGESIFLFTPSCVQVSTQAGIVREVAHPQAHPMQTPAPAWNAAAM